MIGLTLRAAQRGFFDRPAVEKRVDRRTRQVHAKFGAFVRQRARSSIRSRKRTSAAGQPPSSHVGTLKKLIFFVSEPGPPPNVLIGPTLTNQSVRAAMAKSGTVPEVLEKGGQITLTERVKGQWQKRTVTIEPRPYMQPAFEAELPKLPGMWRDSI